MTGSPSAPSGQVRIPSYRRHKGSGQAVVTLGKRDIYLGPYNSARSRREYDRLIAEFLASGRSAPVPPASDLTVSELIAAYWRHCKGYYQAGGLHEIKVALRNLRELYGHTVASKFGPLGLEAYMQSLIRKDLARTTVNKYTRLVRSMFKWSVAQQILPVTVWQALTVVSGLRKGKTAARESKPVKAIPDDVVTETLQFLPPIIADMVRLQRLTGCRPGELCIMRPCDIDRTGDVWTYKPAHHKNEHHDLDRTIYVGPKGQALLLPYLEREAARYCFVPSEADILRQSRRREARKSKLTPSQQKRKRKKHPKRSPGECYTNASYRRAISRAIVSENKNRKPGNQLPNWAPNQLRHTAATEIRSLFGLEGAQVTLGHTSVDTSLIYAERDSQKAKNIARQIG